MFDNLRVLLTGASLDARNLLRTTLYLNSYDDIDEIIAIYRERLPEPYPARVTLQVAGLPLDVRVQIEALLETSTVAG